MLHHDNSQRYSIADVLGSAWFKNMSESLLSNQEVVEKTKQSLFSKLGYVVNVTRIKIPVPPKDLLPDPETKFQTILEA